MKPFFLLIFLETVQLAIYSDSEYNLPNKGLRLKSQHKLNMRKIEHLQDMRDKEPEGGSGTIEKIKE